MSEKYLYVTMPNYTLWKIPAIVIARNRAEYYASKAADGEDLKVLRQELDYALTHDNELLDWASNNMNWIDVVAHAEIVATPVPTVNYQKAWANAPKQVKIKE